MQQTSRTAEPPAGRARKGRKIKFKLFSIGAGMDMPLFFLILVLLSIGLVMLFSASHVNAYYYYGDSYHFIKSQTMFAIMGVAVMLAVSYFDYHKFHRLSWLLYIVTAVMLAIILVVAISDSSNALVEKKGGAYRWLNLGIVEFQPSEIAKFALIAVFADVVSRRQKEMGGFLHGFLPMMGIMGLYVALILPEPHLSATIIIILLGLILMVISGVKMRYLVGTGAIAAAILLLVVLFSDSLAEKFAYVPNRIQGWLDPLNPPAEVDTYQTRQSLYAIGSGGWLGVGLGQSTQKYLFLPEPQNDFIFAIICEELGFIGALIIILLFGMLIWRGIYISLHARDRFGTMMGLGITFQIGIQIVLNICVVTNTLPNTGISLPFFSYGGTSMLILLAEMGVLLQISRSANVEKT